MEFMERSGELNEIKNYPQLTERCKMIGYEVSKVVFRGYYASPKLQALHDNAITRRTNLKLRVSVKVFLFIFILFFYFTEHTQVTPGLPMLQSFHNIYTSIIVIILRLFHFTIWPQHNSFKEIRIKFKVLKK